MYPVWHSWADLTDTNESPVMHLCRLHLQKIYSKTYSKDHVYKNTISASSGHILIVIEPVYKDQILLVRRVVFTM